MGSSIAMKYLYVTYILNIYLYIIKCFLVLVKLTILFNIDNFFVRS